MLCRRALAIVAVAAIAGLLGSFVASDRLESTYRIDDEAEVIESARSIQADLARADAAAAGLRPTFASFDRLLSEGPAAEELRDPEVREALGALGYSD